MGDAIVPPVPSHDPQSLNRYLLTVQLGTILRRDNSIRQSPQRKPTRFTLADAKGCGDLAHRKPLRK